MPKKFLYTFILLGCLATAFTTLRAQPATEPALHPTQSHADWLAGVLKEISAIKPGITRSDFEKTFVGDGGIFSLDNERYCYRGCECIKVEVTFESSGASTRPLSDPNAKLVKISRPYLETPFTD